MICQGLRKSEYLSYRSNRNPAINQVRLDQPPFPCFAVKKHVPGRAQREHDAYRNAERKPGQSLDQSICLIPTSRTHSANPRQRICFDTSVRVTGPVGTGTHFSD
jgi:hypothetical protein